MRERGISFHGRANSGEAKGHGLNPKLCWPCINGPLSQWAKSRGFRGESLGILVVGGGNPRWVVSETRIHVEIQRNFLN